jgi:chaperonin GroEL
MPKPKVIGQPQTTQHFRKGINAIADLLAPTLGPVGGIVANQRDHQRKPELLDDSATTVRRILNLGDRRADVGAMMMRSLVWRVVQRAGDGGATAAVFARAIYNDAVRILAAGANAMQVGKGVNLGVEAAVKELRRQARPVNYENELAGVALTVIREPALAAVLGEMSYLLGPDAHVSIEKYVASYLQQSYHAGASYKAQIASMYMYTDPVNRVAILPAGRIALIDGKLEKVEDVVALLEAAKRSGARSLMIVAGNFSDEVIGLLMKNASNQESAKSSQANGDGQENGKKDAPSKLIIAGSKPKDVGDARRAVFDDLALLTGGVVLGRGWSKAIAQVTPDDLGKTMRVEAGTEIMHIVPEQQHRADVLEKVAEIRSRLAKMTLDDEQRPVLVKRLSALSGGMGVLKIGTESKLDREVRAENAERALKALSAAQHGGVVPGGGAALFHCIPALAHVDAAGDVRYGVDIVERAMAAPLRQIIENAQVGPSSVWMDRIRQAGPTATFDVINSKVVDAYEAGILDVADVLTTVVQTAASGAMMALTTDTIIYHKKPKESFTP